jgi:hypothetical protein
MIGYPNPTSRLSSGSTKASIGLISQRAHVAIDLQGIEIAAPVGEAIEDFGNLSGRHVGSEDFNFADLHHQDGADAWQRRRCAPTRGAFIAGCASCNPE